MASKTVLLVEEKINPIIEKLGYEVVEVEFVKKIDGMNLTFYIDKVGGINIDDCEIVHKAINDPLDELDPTGETSYILNVSSCGLDRPLKTDKDFIRNKGEMVDVKLYKPVENKKQFTGILENIDDKNLFINENGNSIVIDRKLVANVVKHIQF